MKENPVVHFEIPAENKERMKDFYARAFGWTYNQLGNEYGNYTVVMTNESNEKGPKKLGMINGGFFDRAKDNQYPSIVIGVADIREAMKNVESAGGKVLGGMQSGEPDDIPGVGLYCAFIDSEGNRASMIEPKQM